MRRVYAIYVWRQVARPRTAKAFLLACGLFAIASAVSLPHVIQNMPGDPIRALSFFTSAFLATEVLVQVLFLGVIAIAAWFLRDVFTPQFARA